MPGFVEMFKPEKYDLVYGLTETRWRYLTRYIESLTDEFEGVLGERFDTHVYKEAKKLTTYPTDEEIEAMRIVFEATQRDKVMSDFKGDKLKEFKNRYRSFIDFYNEVVSEQDFENTHRLKLTASKVIFVHQYVEALQGTKYKIKETFPNDGPSLQSVLKMKIKSTPVGPDKGLGELSEAEKGILLVNLAIKQSCKYAINYSTFVRNQSKIHFFLDDITMQEVIDATPRTLSSDSTRTVVGVPVTAAELRYTFRNWYYFKSVLNTRLFYYLNYDSTDPPWISGPEQWIDYAKARMDKVGLKNSGQEFQAKALEFNDLYQKAKVGGKSQATAALNCFFSIKTAEPA